MAEEVPLFKIKSSLLPSLNIDSSILGYKSPAKKDLFSYELDLKAKYTERLQELAALKELQKAKLREQDQLKRRSVGEEFQKMARMTQKKIEERNQIAQNSNNNRNEREAQIQQLMRLCPGINKPEEALFYLESQQFNVEAAKNFYTSCTGRSDVARTNSITIKFAFPEKYEREYAFDANSLMWSMLEKIHQNLKQKKNFKVKVKNTGREIRLEEMTKKTFANYGLNSNVVLNIVYD
jgi:hypothetical protein